MMMMMMMTSNELISKFVKYSTMQLAGHQWLSALLVLKFKLLQLRNWRISYKLWCLILDLCDT